MGWFWGGGNRRGGSPAREGIADAIAHIAQARADGVACVAESLADGVDGGAADGAGIIESEFAVTCCVKGVDSGFVDFFADDFCAFDTDFGDLCDIDFDSDVAACADAQGCAQVGLEAEFAIGEADIDAAFDASASIQGTRSGDRERTCVAFDFAFEFGACKGFTFQSDGSFGRIDRGRHFSFQGAVSTDECAAFAFDASGDLSIADFGEGAGVVSGDVGIKDSELAAEFAGDFVVEAAEFDVGGGRTACVEDFDVGGEFGFVAVFGEIAAFDPVFLVFPDGGVGGVGFCAFVAGSADGFGAFVGVGVDLGAEFFGAKEFFADGLGIGDIFVGGLALFVEVFVAFVEFAFGGGGGFGAAVGVFVLKAAFGGKFAVFKLGVGFAVLGGGGELLAGFFGGGGFGFPAVFVFGGAFVGVGLEGQFAVAGAFGFGGFGGGFKSRGFSVGFVGFGEGVRVFGHRHFAVTSEGLFFGGGFGSGVSGVFVFDAGGVGFAGGRAFVFAEDTAIFGFRSRSFGLDRSGQLEVVEFVVFFEFLAGTLGSDFAVAGVGGGEFVGFGEIAGAFGAGGGDARFVAKHPIIGFDFAVLGGAIGAFDTFGHGGGFAGDAGGLGVGAGVLATVQFVGAFGGGGTPREYVAFGFVFGGKGIARGGVLGGCALFGLLGLGCLFGLLSLLGLTGLLGLLVVI